MTTAVLVDLDGTLLPDNIFLPQAAVLTEAITEVYGFDAGYGPEHVPEAVQVDWVGKTDRRIVLEMCKRAGVSDEDAVLKLPQWIDAYMARFLARCPTRLRARRSVVEMIWAAKALGADIRLVTGNLRPVARLKVERALVGEAINLRRSATGSECLSREELVRWALGTLPPSHAVVVGDTWRDVQGAQLAGVPCVALATPKHGVEELLDAGADTVVPADDGEKLTGAVVDLLTAYTSAPRT